MGKKILKITAVVLAALAVGSAAYVMNYYHASDDVRAFLADTEDNVGITETGEGLMLDGPGEDTALIFYPGGKVEYTAYVPQLCKLAESGIDCFLIKMPANLAVFGANKASAVMAQYEYDHWYIGGHSLGGAMAGSFAGNNELDGLILLASYPAEAVDERSIEIWGSEDGVLNMQKLQAGDAFFAQEPEKVVIRGGNHAQFGNYGEQKGDGAAQIARERQQAEAAEAMLAFMNK
ncbi:MAG: alpha/beta hydrolase [Lachnospiraceae bacterium]|nr:alpha/beta hydrolase [Lachnospiraceae bacterium]